MQFYGVGLFQAGQDMSVGQHLLLSLEEAIASLH